MALILSGDSTYAEQAELDALSVDKRFATAWVSFNGDVVDGSNHCEIRGSYNVDYVLRTATGEFEVFFLQAMDNINMTSASSGADTNDNTNNNNYRFKCGVVEYALDRVYIQTGSVNATSTALTNLEISDVVIYGGKA